MKNKNHMISNRLAKLNDIHARVKVVVILKSLLKVKKKKLKLFNKIIRCNNNK